jgi:excisionase family DNA binding protein
MEGHTRKGAGTKMPEATPAPEQIPSNPKLIDLEDMVDIPTGAKLVFVSRKTVENWLSAGRLTRYKVAGGRTLIRRSELVALIKEA